MEENIEENINKRLERLKKEYEEKTLITLEYEEKLNNLQIIIEKYYDTSISKDISLKKITILKLQESINEINRKILIEKDIIELINTEIETGEDFLRSIEVDTIELIQGLDYEQNEFKNLHEKLYNLHVSQRELKLMSVEEERSIYSEFYHNNKQEEYQELMKRLELIRSKHFEACKILDELENLKTTNE